MLFRSKTFLRNHAPHITAIDMFVVPTVGFKLLYGLVIIQLQRRHLVWINVTANPTAEWIARQITEAFPLGSGTPIPHPGPRRLVRPCRNATSRCHGHSGPTNRAAIALAEWTRRTTHRLDRRECLDHVVILGDAHLRRILAKIGRAHV